MSFETKYFLVGVGLILAFMLGAAFVNIHSINQQANNAQMLLIEMAKLKECKDK